MKVIFACGHQNFFSRSQRRLRGFFLLGRIHGAVIEIKLGFFYYLFFHFLLLLCTFVYQNSIFRRIFWINAQGILGAEWASCFEGYDLVVKHDDVIIWKHFLRYWPFVRGIHRSPVNSPHKGQWRGALVVSLICALINGWVNNREAGDLRRHRAHYDVIVMNLGLPRHVAVVQVYMFQRRLQSP